MHIFEFYTGFPVDGQSGDENIMKCPFCEKERHFFYNRNTYLWVCKVCGKHGNAVEFIRELHSLFTNATQATKNIAVMRDLPVSAVADFNIKYNTLNDTYLFPTYKHGKINNMYKYTQLTERDKKTGEWKKLWKMMGCYFDGTLMNWDDPVRDTLWVAEGQTDRLALRAILGNNDLSIGETAIPGANTWKASWCEYIAGKDVVFCLDHDTAGREGLDMIVIKHIANSPNKPKSVSFVDYPDTKPVGYDLNDVYREYGRSSYNQVLSWIKPYVLPKTIATSVVITKTTNDSIEADLSCVSYDQLLAKYESIYHTTDSMRLAMLLVLSSIYSTKVEGEQLWIRLIGAPSSGKSTIAKCVSGSSQVVLKSTFTGLFSGWREAGASGLTDSSLIPQISNKTLIVKDADTLLKQKNVEQIFSELRDFYDKDSNTFYRHGVSHDYHNIRSTMILCGTRVLRRSDQTFLGERFVDYELDLSENDREHIQERMLQRSMDVAMNPSALPPETPVVAAGKGFIEHMMGRNVRVGLGPREMHNIRIWAQLAATLRTKVDREMFGKKEITFDPVIEVPARLIGQLCKLYLCAPVVLDSDVIPPMVHQLAAKVVRDVIDFRSNRMKVCKTLLSEFISRDEIKERSGIDSTDRINTELEDLLALKLVEFVKMPSRSGLGSHVYKFKLKNFLIQGIEHLGAEERICL